VWNVAVSMLKRIRVGLLFKMWLLCLAVTFLYDMYFVYYALPGVQTRVFNSKRQEVQCGTDVALGVLNSHYALEAEGILTTSEAQSRALAEMSNLRYGEDGEGTFWVNDYQTVLLADPTAPTLVNTNVSYITGANGESVFGRMVDMCRNDGGGFYQFRWEYAGGEARNKLSYVAALGMGGGDRSLHRPGDGRLRPVPEYRGGRVWHYRVHFSPRVLGSHTLPTKQAIEFAGEDL
jgi:hypothetical protein